METLFVIRLTGSQTAQQFESFVHVIDSPHVTLSVANGLHDVRPEHQLRDVGGGNLHALFPREADFPADVEKAFDVFVDGTDGLHLAPLVDRSRDGDILP